MRWLSALKRRKRKEISRFFSLCFLLTFYLSSSVPYSFLSFLSLSCFSSLFSLISHLPSLPLHLGLLPRELHASGVASLSPVHTVMTAVLSWTRPQQLTVRACYHGVKNYTRSLHNTTSTTQHNLYFFLSISSYSFIRLSYISYSS